MNAPRTGWETGSTSARQAGRGGRLAFFGTTTALFAVATVVTVISYVAMESMGAVPMAGGWLLSGIWLPLCGQSWLETAACFLGMWLVMTVAMMLPSLAPVLWRYRETALGAGSSRPGALATLAGAGYFVVWTGFGLLVFLLGASLAQIAVRFASLGHLGSTGGALVALIAGLAQFTRWKARLLADCRAARCAAQARPSAMAALGAGFGLGLRCCLSCLGPMAALTAGGLMDLRLMACATVAITAERLFPAETRVAEAVGIAMAITGLLLLAQALG